jgi:hypothetical protein
VSHLPVSEEDAGTAVVVLSAGDKAGMGRVFYDLVGACADQMVD